MAIRFDETKKVFKLDTDHTTYLIGITDQEGFVGHIYYGKRLQDVQGEYLLRTDENPMLPSENERERAPFMDVYKMECPGNGCGDFRESCIDIRDEEGVREISPLYVRHEISDIKEPIEGLPSSFDREGDSKTLKIYMKDSVLGVTCILFYSVFEKEDIITRHVQIRNDAGRELFLEKALSACIDMDDRQYQMLTLHGSWARERQMEFHPIAHGKQSVSSIRGESSHQEHPFIAWMDKNADYDMGEVYAMHFVYSGNFLAQIEKTQNETIRAVMGIHPQNFCFSLKETPVFDTPEVVLTYSDSGLGVMTRNYHDFYRNHLIRSPYLYKSRPVLINNWEATYFDFNEEKLLEIAEESARLGIELFVLDDGWFGHRDSDNSSLGDWTTDERKLPDGLKGLADKINGLGMKFGIWMEPEMISPDSRLYQKHPDWAIGSKNREPAQCRCQYVLDISRREVRDYVFECISRVLKGANIEYLKWDMNRPLCNLYSAGLTKEQQGELSHRYVLALYELQERLFQEFPNVLLENCSSGGARFDPGELYYSPQIWTSDDTDAIERLKIQEGTALIYPLSTIGAHVSVCPNHTVGRNTPMHTRMLAAMAGTFGYELDVTRLSEEDKNQIPDQIKAYKEIQPLLARGDYYRISSGARDNADAYMIVSKDKEQAVLFYVQILAEANRKSKIIRLKGLDPDKSYCIGEYEGTSAEVLRGDTLMYAGFRILPLNGDFTGRMYTLCVDKNCKLS